MTRVPDAIWIVLCRAYSYGIVIVEFLGLNLCHTGIGWGKLLWLGHSCHMDIADA